MTTTSSPIGPVPRQRRPEVDLSYKHGRQLREILTWWQEIYRALTGPPGEGCAQDHQEPWVTTAGDFEVRDDRVVVNMATRGPRTIHFTLPITGLRVVYWVSQQMLDLGPFTPSERVPVEIDGVTPRVLQGILAAHIQRIVQLVHSIHSSTPTDPHLWAGNTLRVWFTEDGPVITSGGERVTEAQAREYVGWSGLPEKVTPLELQMAGYAPMRIPPAIALSEVAIGKPARLRADTTTDRRGSGPP